VFLSFVGAEMYLAHLLWHDIGRRLINGYPTVPELYSK
jgi:hypothetical protein